MPPSKKILLGASAVITGVLGQIILGMLLTRDILPSTPHPGDRLAAAESLDQSLERIHEQTSIGFNAMTLSYLFIITGLILLLTGIYQNARATERLQDRHASES